MTECEFYEWFDNIFSYGYGTGEPHVLRALKNFFSLCEKIHKGDYPYYKYETLETHLGPEVAWLIINALCSDNTIEYGTSPRYGWLGSKGRQLWTLFQEHTVEELADIIASEYEQHVYG